MENKEEDEEKEGKRRQERGRIGTVFWRKEHSPVFLCGF